MKPDSVDPKLYVVCRVIAIFIRGRFCSRMKIFVNPDRVYLARAMRNSPPHLRRVFS